ncbi:DUF6858 family protein [endosymbiont of Ridgeia piscesae]|uniref:Uncharacterized protein n=1 Tax=endosymbiont of Ridgeia piscesae TaxID=54398 RepID=A0A0T5ZAL9_9GAMM|nr:hypothetical protein [endosymbiont of Ridgeia piscesae]KRT53552.1 hypothetical protein Ga0074115_106108 [endosymbiont of Ridgeia piscesae]KRT59864.1 hypothetical protein Ga0076813_16222 [endosymbiont of Ridgeia piscesae]
MKQELIEETFPIFLLEIEREECLFQSVEAIADYLREHIEAHPSARYIATFDHFAHTRELPEGQVADSIHSAINLVFCFGLTLQEPETLAIRPRSIGICDSGDRFIITFMEPPMPVVNAAMEHWAHSLIKRPKSACAMRAS